MDRRKRLWTRATRATRARRLAPKPALKVARRADRARFRTRKPGPGAPMRALHRHRKHRSTRLPTRVSMAQGSRGRRFVVLSLRARGGGRQAPKVDEQANWLIATCRGR